MPDETNPAVDTQPEVEPATDENKPAQDSETNAKVEPETAAIPSEETKAESGAPAQTTETGPFREEQPDEPEAEPPVIRVKFNKKEQEFTHEQAAPLIQMGLKYESIKAQVEKLKDIAAGVGVSTDALIDSLLKNQDDALYQQTLKECDGNEALAQRLFNSAKAERTQRIQKAKDEETAREKKDVEDEQAQFTNRLSSEYLELTHEFPGVYKKFADIPNVIINTAMKKNISLLDAYLRFQHTESKKSSAAKAQQAEAAKKSAGSMADKPQSSSPEIDALMNGIWGQ